MKTRILVVVIAILLLLVGNTVQTLTGGQNATATGAISGGSYHLDYLAWQVNGITSGGGYHLVSQEASTLRGNGCCCTYLPCVVHTAP